MISTGNFLRNSDKVISVVGMYSYTVKEKWRLRHFVRCFTAAAWGEATWWVRVRRLRDSTRDPSVFKIVLQQLRSFVPTYKWRTIDLLILNGSSRVGVAHDSKLLYSGVCLLICAPRRTFVSRHDGSFLWSIVVPLPVVVLKAREERGHCRRGLCSVECYGAFCFVLLLCTPVSDRVLSIIAAMNAIIIYL